jgi:hypothetical protein
MPTDLIGTNSSVIPDNLAYIFKPNSIVPSMTRYISSFSSPEQGENGYKKNNIIRLRVNSAFIDFSKCNLQFSTAISGTGGTYIRHRWNIGTVFSQVRILFGSTEVSLTENFALIDTLVQLVKTGGYINSVGKQQRGLGDATARNAQANSGFVYSLYLGDVVKLLSLALPIYKIQEQMTIELTVNDPNNCLESDKTALDMIINNVKLHYDTIQISKEIDNMITQRINNNFCIPFLQFANYTSTQMLSGTLNVSTQLPFRYISLAGVLGLARNSANLADPTVNDTYNTFLGYSNLSNNYLKINNVLLPSDKVSNVSDQLNLSLEFWGECIGKSEAYMATDWSKYFHMAFSLMQDSKQAYSYDDQTVQGVGANSSGFSLLHNLTLSSNAVNIELNYFGMYYACLRINPSGTLTYSS